MLQYSLEQLGASEGVCEREVALAGVQGVLEVLGPLAVVVGLPHDPVDLLEEAGPVLTLLPPDFPLHAEAEQIPAAGAPQVVDRQHVC